VTAEWERLAAPSSQGLLDALRGIAEPPAPAVIERLRARHDPSLVAMAIELSLARTRAAPKFGPAAAGLWMDRAGAEMASDPAIAAWKAARFREAGAGRIDDLCCGIGGDLMALARVAEPVGADLDPARAWMAARNAGCTVRCVDAVLEPGDAPFVHVDPARRDARGARAWRLADLVPGLAAVRAMLDGRRGGAVKLGPGMDLADDERLPTDQVEFIGDGDRLAQQVLWTGQLATPPGINVATRIDLHRTICGIPAALEGPGAGGHARRVLLVPDPALERARLVHVLAPALTADELWPGLGILTTDRVPSGRDDASAWFTAYEVLEELPAREASVRDWMRARGAGRAVVRTRGGACDPDAWQRMLRGSGDGEAEIFVVRFGERRRAYAVRRIAPG
jgi:hypothetical protein